MDRALGGEFLLFGVLALWLGSFVAMVWCATRWGKLWQVPIWCAVLVLVKAPAVVAFDVAAGLEDRFAIEPERLVVSYLLTVVIAYIFVGLAYLKRRFSPLT